MDSKKFANVQKKPNKTQKEMAEILGTSIKAVHSYEQGWQRWQAVRKCPYNQLKSFSKNIPPK